MKVENQTVSLCFPIPIWRLEFADFEPVNDEIRRQLAQVDWDKLDRENRAVYDSLHIFSEDRFSDPIASPEIMFKADEGTMLVFPAWLPHKVPTNTSGRCRVSISFNAELRSKDDCGTRHER